MRNSTKAKVIFLTAAAVFIFFLVFLPMIDIKLPSFADFLANFSVSDDRTPTTATETAKNNTPNVADTIPAETDDPNPYNIAPPSPPLEGIYYDGEFELPVNGATGYASVDIYVTESPYNYANRVAALQAGSAFMIILEQGDWWQIATDGISGWVQHAFCMINLPDVVPSIIYDNTNAYSSKFISSGRNIPNITGEALYSSRTYNERLGKHEFIMPVLYSTAKRVCAAQRIAMANGDTLVMYEAFRPYGVQMQIVKELTALSNADTDVRRGISASPWNITWFIATGVSNHQRGYAVDAGLAKAVQTAEEVTGNYIYVQVTESTLYTMPTPIHELSSASAIYTRPVDINSLTAWRNATYSQSMRENKPAQDLQRYFTEAGFTPLASEWWHFNDLHTLRAITRYSNGNYETTVCLSAAPE